MSVGSYHWSCATLPDTVEDIGHYGAQYHVCGTFFLGIISSSSFVSGGTERLLILVHFCFMSNVSGVLPFVAYRDGPNRSVLIPRWTWAFGVVILYSFTLRSVYVLCACFSFFCLYLIFSCCSLVIWQIIFVEKKVNQYCHLREGGYCPQRCRRRAWRIT